MGLSEVVFVPLCSFWMQSSPHSSAAFSEEALASCWQKRIMHQIKKIVVENNVANDTFLVIRFLKVHVSIHWYCWGDTSSIFFKPAYGIHTKLCNTITSSADFIRVRNLTFLRSWGGKMNQMVKNIENMMKNKPTNPFSGIGYLKR